MREICIGKNSVKKEGGEELTCVYLLTVEEQSGQISFESYGIKINIAETGESAQVDDLTVNAERVWALGEALCRNGVTPCGLGDVVADWL